MAKMTIDVDDKALDKTIKEEIRRLQRKIKTLESSNYKLKSKVEEQKSKAAMASRVISEAKCMIEEFGNYEWDE